MDIKLFVILLGVLTLAKTSAGSKSNNFEQSDSLGLPKIRERRSALWTLFQTKVVQAQLYARKSKKGKGYDHYGVVVTTKKGKRWLVHKGHHFGTRSNTVVTDAAHMSSKWNLIRTKKIKNAKILDFLGAGGRYFHPVHDNAYHAAKRMMNLG